MHEISLVQGLLRQLAQLAEKHGAVSVKKVVVEVGPMSGIVVDSFQFGFEALAGDQQLTRDAVLEIRIPSQEYKCLHCRSSCVIAASDERRCPQCGENMLFPEGGDELILLQVEMEEAQQ